MGQANFLKKLTKCQGVTCDGLTSHPAESSNTPGVATCYGNWDKLSWTGHVVRAQTFKPPLPLPPSLPAALRLRL